MNLSLTENLHITGRRPCLTLDACRPKQVKVSWAVSDCIDNLGKLRAEVLFLSELPPPHSSANIKVKFQDETAVYKIKTFKVITDNSANMKLAFNEAQTPTQMTEHIDENDIFVVEYTEFDVVERIIFELENKWFDCFADI